MNTENKETEIHSVKRLSDGKMFSIGDEVRYIIGNKAFPFTITGFFIVGHDNSIFAENEYHFCNINYETFDFTDTQKREMTEQVKREYQEYLDYMYEYEEENGNYPMHLSNGQWTPYSTTEYLDKTKNGTERLNF